MEFKVLKCISALWSVPTDGLAFFQNSVECWLSCCFLLFIFKFAGVMNFIDLFCNGTSAGVSTRGEQSAELRWKKWVEKTRHRRVGCILFPDRLSCHPASVFTVMSCVFKTFLPENRRSMWKRAGQCPACLIKDVESSYLIQQGDVCVFISS